MAACLSAMACSIPQLQTLTGRPVILMPRELVRTRPQAAIYRLAGQPSTATASTCGDPAKVSGGWQALGA